MTADVILGGLAVGLVVLAWYGWHADRAAREAVAIAEVDRQMAELRALIVQRTVEMTEAMAEPFRQLSAAMVEVGVAMERVAGEMSRLIAALAASDDWPSWEAEMERRG